MSSSMNYKVEYLPLAIECLSEIQRYYAYEFDIDTARKVRGSITKTISRLETFPYSGSLTPDSYLNELGYKMIICKIHVAIYKIVESKILIYYIADTRTDYSNLFIKHLHRSDVPSE